MADLVRRVGKMLAMRPMTIIPLRRGASAIYNRVTAHVQVRTLFNRVNLGITVRSEGLQSFEKDSNLYKKNIHFAEDVSFSHFFDKKSLNNDS